MTEERLTSLQCTVAATREYQTVVRCIATRIHSVWIASNGEVWCRLIRDEKEVMDELALVPGTPFLWLAPPDFAGDSSVKLEVQAKSFRGGAPTCVPDRTIVVAVEIIGRFLDCSGAILKLVPVEPAGPEPVTTTPPGMSPRIWAMIEGMKENEGSG